MNSQDRKHVHSHIHRPDSGGHHAHGPGCHHHGPLERTSRSYAIAFFANLGFAIVELIGGFLTQSLAISADAIHDFGDAMSIGMAWYLEKFSAKNRDESFNFGYRRFSLMAALLTAAVILAGSIGIAYQAVLRLSTPQVPVAEGMMLLAILGVVVNAGSALALRRAQKSGRASHSEKLLTWHLVEDLMGWVIVFVGAVVIRLTGWAWVDPVLAIALSGFIVWNVGKNLKETLYLLLQGRPQSFNELDLRQGILRIPGVGNLDRLQVWSLDGAASVVSLRLHLHEVHDRSQVEQVKASVRRLCETHGAVQTTIETCLIDRSCAGSD